MAWRVARSLDKLLAQINAYAPRRSKISDGSIGDAAHSSRASDHNPDPRGIVHARDFTHSPATGFNAHEFVRRLAKAKDRRIKYLISNRQISNPSIGAGRWRPYSGINGHTQHAHVSCVYGALEDDTATWPGLGAAGGTVTAPSKPAPLSKSKGVLGMAKHLMISSKKKQTANRSGGALVLKTNGNSKSAIVVGPAEFAFTANVTLANLKPGHSAWLRVVRGGYKKGKALKVGRTLAYQEYSGTTGTTAVSISAAGLTGKESPKGYSSRIYLLITTNNPEPLDVTQVRVEGLRG